MSELAQFLVEGKPVCPGCGVALTGATNATDQNRPVPGSLSICVYCGELSRFQEDYSLKSFDLKACTDMEPAEKIRVTLLLIHIRANLQPKPAPDVS